MTVDTETLKLIAEIVQGLVVLVGVFVYIKKGQYNEAASILQATFSNAVSKVQYTGTAHIDMKTAATRIVHNSLEDVEIANAVKKLGIKMDAVVISDMIERTLSSGKLGVTNPIADVLRARGKGAVLGFLTRKLNKIKI